MPKVKVEYDPEITMGPTRAVINGSRRKMGKATRNGSMNHNGHTNGSFNPEATVKQEEEESKITDDNTFSDDDYVDDEYEGMAEDENGTEYWVCKEIRIPQVPKPTIVMHTLVDLYNISKGPYMNLEPEYQREVVWDEHRSSELIKSIFIGYFIPPLIFNVLGPKFEADEKGVKKEKYYRVCVDGKQRMTSVLKFMDGHIGFFDASHPPKKWYYRHPVINGVEKITNRNIMPEAMKKKFRESKFCCYEYVALSASTEETMFQLVQRGIALTPAERMKAMSTEWAQFTKKYEEEYSMVVNLSKQTRASGFRTVLTIFTMIQEVMARAEAGRTGIPTLQSSPQALNKVLNDREPINESLKLEFKEVFDKFAALVKFCSTNLQEPYERWVVNRNTAFDPAPDFLKEEAVNHVKTYSPLELLATGILLAKHMRNRSDSLLLGDIKEMRHFLREKHKDLRVNAQCWVSTWEFLDFELLKRRGGPNGEPMPNTKRHSVMMAELMADDGEEFDAEDPDATISAENSGIEDEDDGDEDEEVEEEEEQDVDIVHALFGASADAQSKRLRRPSGSSSRSSSSASSFSGTFSKRPKK